MMPCTLVTGALSEGGGYEVSLLPSMNTESDGAALSTRRNALFWPRPPVREVRATWKVPTILTSEPSYCSRNVLVGVSLSCVVVPTKNGGSGLPELTLRTMKFGEPKLLFGAKI